VTLLQAVVIGIVQGLTEFLPVSSTAHLRVVPALLGWNDPGAAFSAVIQCGTLAAVLAYFRREIALMAQAFFRETARGQCCQSPEGSLAWKIILGTIPIVVCGVALKHPIETTLRSLYVISAALIGVAVFLGLAEIYLEHRRRSGRSLKSIEGVSWLDAATIGLAQAISLVPGSSRSGVTITAGLFRGLERDTAARFSFLLSLPAVLAAGLFELYHQRKELLSSSADVLNLVASTVASGVVGYAAIAFLLYFLKTRTTWVFIIYRVALGVLLLVLLAGGHLRP